MFLTISLYLDIKLSQNVLIEVSVSHIAPHFDEKTIKLVLEVCFKLEIDYAYYFIS